MKYWQSAGEEAKMWFFGKLNKDKRGIGSIIGAVFIALILVSGFTFYTLTLNITEHYDRIVGSMSEMDWSRSRENVVIRRVEIIGTNKLNLTVENAGSISSHLVWLGILNKTATPETQRYYALNDNVGPAETKSIVSDFSVEKGKRYVIQLVTELGNTIEHKFYPAGEVRCALTLITAPPTTYQGNNVTVLLTVTHNDTEVDTIQNLTVTLQANPSGLVAVKEQPSSLSVETLASERSVFFKWVYNTIGTGTVTFNASYVQAPYGVYTLSPVEIVSSPGQGAIMIDGKNCTAAYSPLGWNLIEATQYASGSVSDLQSDNATYMTFRSYVSASPTGKTDAFIAYVSNTGNLSSYPKNRLWDGDTASWGGENEMATTGSPVRWVLTAVCPKSERALEKIVVTLSLDGYLDAYVFDGTSWSVTSNIASIWTTAPADPIRPYDIAYETSSGRALLVYDVNLADATKDLGYKIWNFGTGWSTEYYIDFTGAASTNPVLSFISLASNPDSTSNQVGMAFNDGTNGDAFATIWDGSTWNKMTTLTTTNTIAAQESIAVEYSTYYKKILAVAGNGANSMAWKTYTQGDTGWTAQTAFDPDPDPNNDVSFGTLKRDPAANSTRDYIMYVGVTDLWDLNAFAFDMAGSPPTRVNIVNEVDDAIDSGTSRCIDFAWEPTGNKGLIVWGTTFGYIHYNTYSISTGWGASWTTSATMGGSNAHPWVQLRTNARTVNGDVKILGAVLEDTANDLGAIKWDGTTFTVIGASTFTADTTASAYECFELEFQNFGDPSEFTSEVEFTGTSNTESWTQLVWIVDSAWTIGSVTVTLQLYNYTLDDYPTSGDGYISYTSDATPNIDETKTQTITTKASDFRNSTGHWRIKIKGVKSTNTQFQMKIDWIDFQTTYSSTDSSIPYNAWQWYAIKATAANGDPIPCTYISIYANGTNVAFRDAVNKSSVTNPGWVRLNANGEYYLEIKSTHTSPETFVLYVVVGSVVGQKTITQEETG